MKIANGISPQKWLITMVTKLEQKGSEFLLKKVFADVMKGVRGLDLT